MLINENDLERLALRMAAANLIGVVTSRAALRDARVSFPRWQGTAHSCMVYQLKTPMHEVLDDDAAQLGRQ